MWQWELLSEEEDALLCIQHWIKTWSCLFPSESVSLSLHGCISLSASESEVLSPLAAVHMYVDSFCHCNSIITVQDAVMKQVSSWNQNDSCICRWVWFPLMTKDNLFVRDYVFSNRIVVHGERFARAVVPYSAKPFNFQMEYQLTEEQVTGCVCCEMWSYMIGLTKAAKSK